MNRYLQRVVAAYAVVVLGALLYVPWHGPLDGSPLGEVLIRYAPLWLPPHTDTVQFSLDYRRLLLAVISLTQVLLLAVVSLWGDGPE
ncbi:MAG: hypothetical protein IH614_06025 [Desulfuromonadales bacterium]|nr:hypothetical protein [Desulfuromonadales bacterium]